MNILDPRFKYTPSHKTDIRELFERVRKELAAQAQSKPQQPVTTIKRKTA